MAADFEALQDEVVALRRELVRLRTGELVARLSEVERQEIAARVVDQLEPLLRQRTAKREEPPRRRASKKKPFFRD